MASSPAISSASTATSTTTNSGPSSEEVKAAMKEFKNLSKSEKKEKFRDVKAAVKEYKKNKKNGTPSDNTLLLVILAILLPPLAVYLHEGEVNTRFWISLLLTILFWIPGVIYALIVVLGDQ
jgi:uncharacterized membrane protein YqaE (UPF0057 family)